jgi:hypothetical protein
VTAKNQKPNLRPRKIRSASFLIGVISGVYLLAMIWLLLSTMGKYGTHETLPWLGSAGMGVTVAYGILMLLLWPNEEAAPQPRSR